MAENIGGNDLLSSGGHRWDWTPPAVTEKVLGTAGTVGVAGVRTHVGAAVVVITGILKAACIDDMNNLINALVSMVTRREKYDWEDDQGSSGDALVLTSFAPGRRQHAADGSGRVWLPYTLTAEERAGGPHI